MIWFQGACKGLISVVRVLIVSRTYNGYIGVKAGYNIYVLSCVSITRDSRGNSSSSLATTAFDSENAIHRQRLQNGVNILSLNSVLILSISHSVQRLLQMVLNAVFEVKQLLSDAPDGWFSVQKVFIGMFQKVFIGMFSTVASQHELLSK